MAIDYKPHLHLEAVMGVLDDYIIWFGQVVRKAFCKEFKDMEVALDAKPFQEWLESTRDGNEVNHSVLSDLERIHSDMMNAAESFIILGRAATPTGMGEAYDEFKKHYEGFIQRMRRLERDSVLDNNGMDEKTGLRSLKVMKEDIERELHRMARRGTPFCLAYVRIDQFPTIQWGENEDDEDKLVRRSANFIKDCLRSFDDAYYLGKGDFLLFLKQTDMHGSQAAITRFNIIVRDAKTRVMVASGSTNLTFSTCIAEPHPGDRVEDLLTHMRNDLTATAVDGGMVLQYQDISPLQRYVQSARDK